ncbi:hypothetical protein PGB34_01210 [Xenophilus arseniciresistens]|uniref:DUF2946 domain-containing protein n=1 Tax=Xenophilus arseniciresistens TaxID=1283306 RepID=A0AAE3N3Q3_9BURK|nr:hypothetical protein [Xenophilus arseniciresistens]MDA7414970.1 hypothetical protein [Xenophilus arseniciresistens]
MSFARPFAAALHRPQRLRQWAAWLVLALCFAGTMGQMHRALHAPGLHALAASAAAAAQAHPSHAVAQAAHSHGWFDQLFGAHREGDAECRLYDQLSGDPALLAVAPVLLPLQLPMAQLRLRAGEFIARWVALFDARGPPPGGLSLSA